MKFFFAICLAFVIGITSCSGQTLADSSKSVPEMQQAKKETLGPHVAQTEQEGRAESSSILHHVTDSHEIGMEPFGVIHLPRFAPVHFLGLTIDLSITKHVVFVWVAALVLLLLMSVAAKKNAARVTPRGFGNLIEILIVFIRDEVILPTIGREGLRFLPFFLTLFFFILACNLLGLIPYGSTATGNVNVTASLAIISFFFIQIAGIMKNGFLGYFKGLIPHGVPLFVIPIMIVVESIGLFTKPFALCIRLFANMTAGHIVILSMISLIFTLGTILVAPVSVVFALFLTILEIFIALLQAYVFTVLTSLFVSLAMNQEH
jgi:F-type H+-transporting ATPase subunit a